MIIVIYGKRGEGKTALAHLIRTELTSCKLPAQNQDTDIPDHFNERLAAVRERLLSSGDQIIIETRSHTEYANLDTGPEDVNK